jgi:hypothetical protein
VELDAVLDAGCLPLPPSMAAATASVVVVEPVAPALSVTVKRTVTLPVALSVRLAVLPVVAPLSAAKLWPLVICHA